MTPRPATAAVPPDWRIEAARLLPSILLASMGTAFEPLLAAAGAVPILVFGYCVVVGRFPKR
ncbi:Hypothetical protein MexAM1_META2p0451 (plasmid) [Methylorubrum extorquens AM1]|uniref:Uncharacterized protein n=1 Tax=Methylorubrum extorquens (strain ATCC 14718 / DSM 1338 / JCM 2805 / NCIMB 9133 / AM1) TaxID=272630 RepID=C5B4C1_METEA|nr:Hypothetical protein MexAM1_META2p0451 [Methylorubrum extorquens AM1]